MNMRHLRHRKPWACRTPPGKKLAIRRDRLRGVKGACTERVEVERAKGYQRIKHMRPQWEADKLINGTEMNCLRPCFKELGLVWSVSQVYYYHAVTRQTTWVKPPPEFPSVLPASLRLWSVWSAWSMSKESEKSAESEVKASSTPQLCLNISWASQI